MWRFILDQTLLYTHYQEVHYGPPAHHYKVILRSIYLTKDVTFIDVFWVFSVRKGLVYVQPRGRYKKNTHRLIFERRAEMPDPRSLVCRGSQHGIFMRFGRCRVSALRDTWLLL